jgi:hypothetical protein
MHTRLAGTVMSACNDANANDSDHAGCEDAQHRYTLPVRSHNGNDVYELNDTVSLYTRDETINARRRYIGSAQTLFFARDPLMIVRGRGQYLYDDQGHEYLDCVSNVQHGRVTLPLCIGRMFISTHA